MKKINILLAIALCSQAIQATISIANLKGTHDILKDYSDWYAPFWGLPFAENDVARNLYIFSDFYNKKQFEEKSKDTPNSPFEFLLPDIEAYFKQDHKTATQTMVKSLFAEVAGTFNVTNSGNNPVKYLTFKDIGKIIRIMHDGLHNNKAKAKSDPYDTIKANLLTYFKEILQKIPTASKNDFELFKQFSNALIGSLKECSATNPDHLFPENTTQGILLGYILMKGNNRSDLQDYFKGFLGKEIHLPNESYTKEELAALIDTSTTPVGLQNINSVANYICAQEYHNLYQSALPKLVIFSSKTTFHSFMFSDCVETALLNLANIATYNPEQHTCQTTIPALKEFYQTYNTNTELDINHIAAHNAWTNLIENIPYVYYKRIGHLQSNQEFNTYTIQCDGFIPVPTADTTLPKRKITIGSKEITLYEKKWNNQTFLLVPAATNLVCFEVRASLRNIIIVMNTLFNLDLYQDNDATFDPHFETTYFASLAKKLEWKIDDIGNSCFNITTEHGNTFTLNIRQNLHGYIEIPIKTSVADTPFENTTLEQLKAINIALQAARISDIKDLYFGNLKDPNIRLKNLQNFIYTQTIQDKKSPIIDNNIISLGFINDNFIRSSISTTYSNTIYSMNIMAAINVFLYQNLTDATLKSFSSSQIKPIFEFAKTKFADLNPAESNNGFTILQSLLNNKLIDQPQIQDLLEFAKTKLAGPNSAQSTNAFKIISNLIDSKLLNQPQIQNLFEFAKAKLADPNSAQSTNAFKIMIKLIYSELLSQLQIQDLLEFAETKLADSNSATDASDIINELIDSALLTQPQIQDLLEFTIAKLTDPNSATNASKIINELIDSALLTQPQIQDLFKFAITKFEDPNPIQSNNGLTILQKLLYNKPLTQTQIQDLLELVKANLSNPSHANNTFVIINLLLNNNLLNQPHIQDLFEFAKANLFNPDLTQFSDGFDILQRLLNNKLLNQTQIQSIFEQAKANLFDPSSEYNTIAIIHWLIGNKLLSQSQIQDLFEFAHAHLSNKDQAIQNNATEIINDIKNTKLLDDPTIKSLQRNNIQTNNNLITV